MEDFSPSEAYCLFLSWTFKKAEILWGEFDETNQKKYLLQKIKRPIIYMQLILNISIPVRCALIVKENVFK